MHRTRVWMNPLLALALALVPAACKDDLLGPQDPEDVVFDASLNVDLDRMTRLDSGVYYEILIESEGAPTGDGATVIVDYTLWLPNGTEVDSATEETLRLNEGQVIEGFRQGMLGMEEGERRLIVVPSYLGYGAAGNTPLGIPPHSVLVYVVDLVVLNPPM